MPPRAAAPMTLDQILEQLDGLNQDVGIVEETIRHLDGLLAPGAQPILYGDHRRNVAGTIGAAAIQRFRGQVVELLEDAERSRSRHVAQPLAVARPEEPAPGALPAMKLARPAPAPVAAPSPPHTTPVAPPAPPPAAPPPAEKDPSCPDNLIVLPTPKLPQPKGVLIASRAKPKKGPADRTGPAKP